LTYDCFCSGSETEIDPWEVDLGHTKPQLVYLTFDGAFSQLASTSFYDRYEKGVQISTNAIFATRKVSPKST